MPSCSYIGPTAHRCDSFLTLQSQDDHSLVFRLQEIESISVVGDTYSDGADALLAAVFAINASCDLF